jgi:hypothetical protein
MTAVSVLKLTEQEWQSRVIDYAKLRGWLVHHTRPARTDKGWRTALEGDAGFPDLVLARKGHIFFVELKTEVGLLTKGQKAWIWELESHEVGARVWRPSDWPEVQRALA